MVDPAERNLRITQTYHELAVALVEQLGQINATWYAYATWASRTAGVFIRGENIKAANRRYLNSSNAVQNDTGRVKILLRRLGQKTDLDELPDRRLTIISASYRLYDISGARRRAKRVQAACT